MTKYVVEYTFLALLVGIFIWRIVLPGMKTRMGGTFAAAPVAGAAATSSSPPTAYEKMKQRFEEYFWTIALALAAAAVFYWSLYTPRLRFSQVGGWAWDRWLWVLVFGAIVFLLIKLNEKALGTMAGTLQSALVGAMFLLFIGIPVGIWVKDLFLPQVICKDVSAHETRSCTLNTAWSSWVKFAEGPENNGMRLCLTPGGTFERTDINGTTFWRFKADEGRLIKSYRLMPGDQKCPATLH